MAVRASVAAALDARCARVLCLRCTGDQQQHWMRAVPVCCLRRHGGSAAAQDDARCTCVLFGVTQFEVPSGAACWVAWERARGAAAAQYARCTCALFGVA